MQKAIAKEIFKKCNRLLGVDDERNSRSIGSSSEGTIVDSQQADAQSSDNGNQVDEDEVEEAEAR